MDSYGEKRFWQFLEDIGATSDLENTIQNVFNISMKELENGWLQYLEDIELDPNLIHIQPEIIDMSPAHNPDRLSGVSLVCGRRSAPKCKFTDIKLERIVYDALGGI